MLSAAITALVPVVIQAVIDLVNGKSPEEVLPKLQAAAVAYNVSLSEWEQAKSDNP